jgi:hypothetical protein
MPINPKSSWPFTPFLVQNVIAIETAAKAGVPKKPLIIKTIERFFRAGARMMEHYGVPADQVLAIAREQIEREGGKVAQARLAALDDAIVSKVISKQDQSTDLVAGWLTDAAKPADKETDPDEPKAAE